jgi:Ca2+-binding EF-hand superfamily protein
MSALIAAQSQSGATASAFTDPSSALKDLFSQIDADGDGKITQSEFENALGAGGTNLAQADDVFNKLDTNGDGTVSSDELSKALKGAGHGGHHHHHAGGASDAGAPTPADRAPIRSRRRSPVHPATRSPTATARPRPRSPMRTDRR